MKTRLLVNSKNGLCLSILLLCTFLGCSRPWLGQGWFANDPNRTISPVLSPNPASVVITDHEFAWNQIVDELDNYFRIKKEDRIRLDEGIISEGIITTYPTPGSTLLEPWRKDSTRGFEKIHSTLHSVRRTAKVRVIPSGQTYLVEVEVIKEMEDLPQPENSTIGQSLNSNISTRFEEVGGADLPRQKSRWYPMGRDTSLEQQILANIQGRLRI